MEKREEMGNVTFRISKEHAKELRTIVAQKSIKSGKRFTYGMLMGDLLEAYREAEDATNLNN